MVATTMVAAIMVATMVASQSHVPPPQNHRLHDCQHCRLRKLKPAPVSSPRTVSTPTVSVPKVQPLARPRAWSVILLYCYTGYTEPGVVAF